MRTFTSCCWLLTLTLSCATDTERPPPASGTPALVLLSSDFRGSSAIDLLDANGRCLSDGFYDSGSARTGLVAPLSGDVVLGHAGGQRVFLVDRLGVDIVTEASWTLPPRPEPVSLRNYATQLPQTGQAAYQPNPQDALPWEGQLFVPRNEANLDTNADALDLGDDIARIDTRRGALTGRIPLPASPGFFARPATLKHLWGPWAVQGLWHLSGDFQQTGPGRVALVDLANLRTHAVVDLEPLRNCGAVATAPGCGPSQCAVFVLCRGDTFASFSSRSAHAGIARLEFRAAALAGPQVTLWQPTQPEAAPTHGLVANDTAQVLYLSEGQLVPAQPDILWATTLAGEPTRAFAGNEAFSLGQPAHAGGAIWVPDAAGSLHALPQPGGERKTQPPCSALPPRALAALGNAR